MVLGRRLRFQGYWWSLIAWIMLSLLTPAAKALTATDQGYLRLCSASGAHWVSAAPATAKISQPSAQVCLCLHHAGLMASPTLQTPALAWSEAPSSARSHFYPAATITTHPARAPPV